jgi:hypothetical protein
MPIAYLDNRVVCAAVVSVEEADALQTWLQTRADATLDLTDCTHVHPANLQVLLAAGTRVHAWPADAALRAWLQPLLLTQ